MKIQVIPTTRNRLIVDRAYAKSAELTYNMSLEAFNSVHDYIEKVKTTKGLSGKFLRWQFKNAKFPMDFFDSLSTNDNERCQKLSDSIKLIDRNYPIFNTATKINADNARDQGNISLRLKNMQKYLKTGCVLEFYDYEWERIVKLSESK